MISVDFKLLMLLCATSRDTRQCLTHAESRAVDLMSKCRVADQLFRAL